jgi:hypothetical protein
METEHLHTVQMPPSSLWAGGLLAFSLVIFQGFLSQQCLDLPALISVFTLALAMPILAYKILADTVRVRRYNVRTQIPHRTALRTPYPELIIFIIGVFAALVGVGAAFWHIHWASAIIFLACTGALLIGTYFFHVRT